MSLHYVVKYRCSRNCHAQDLGEASCHARLSHSKQLFKKSLQLFSPCLVHWLKDIQSNHTKNPTVWLYVSAATQKKRYSVKMPLRIISGQLVTDNAYQRASQNGLLRLIFVTTKVRINGLTNVTTVNSSFFISYVKSMANSSSYCRTVLRRTERMKQPSCL